METLKTIGIIIAALTTGITILVLLVSIFLGMQTNRGFSYFTTFTAPTLQTKVYNISTGGMDMAVYVFKHPTNSNYTCMTNASSNGNGLKCLPNESWDSEDKTNTILKHLQTLN